MFLRDFTLRQKRDAYKDCFSSAAGKEVLKDLAVFCRAEEPTFISGDTHGTAFNEGMRRVFLRLMKLSNMSDDVIQTMEQVNIGVEDGR